jgi:autotransporter passenger strand-loop-strand repeat protein
MLIAHTRRAGIDFVVSGGVTLEVASGGIASGTKINKGGFEYVSSGGIANGTTLSGGTLEIASGGSTGSAPIAFTSRGGTFSSMHR